MGGPRLGPDEPRHPHRSRRPARPVVHRAAVAPARWAFPRLPGVLRAARGELPHRHGADHQRGLRLHRDAHQPAARRAAHAPRGVLRRLTPDVPVGALHRVQGQPHHHARRLPRPGRPDQGGPARARHPRVRRGRLRGRRPDRHPRHAGRGRRLPGAHHQRRSRRVPAGQRQRHGALPDARGVRAGPDRSRCRDGALRAHPRPVPGLRGAARRPFATTCPPSRASGRRRPRSGCASSARSPSSPTGSTR